MGRPTVLYNVVIDDTSNYAMANNAHESFPADFPNAELSVDFR
jgi:hypothetical protein